VEAFERFLKGTAMQSILLIDHNRASLTVARSLHGMGYKVIAGIAGYCDYTNLSRFVSENVAIADLVDAPEQAMRDIHALAAARPDIKGIFSVDETGTRYLADRYHELPAQVKPLTAKPKNILDSMNKADTAALAHELGIPVAQRLVVENWSDLKAAAHEIGYPFVIRAVESNHDLYGHKVLVCHNAGDFERAAQGWPQEGHQRLMVQHFNAGHRHNICWNAINGRIHSAIEMQVLLSTTGTHSGYGTLVETVEPTPQLKRYSEMLAEALDFHGAGSPQFLVDHQTGEITFLEINPRLDANIKLAQNVMPYIETAIGIVDGKITQPLEQPWAYKRGKRLFWMKGENQTLKTLKANRQYGKLVSRAAMMLPNSIGNVHALFSWDDPAPALASHLNPVLSKLPQNWMPRLPQHVSVSEPV
jgi:biotin carboxylase